MNSFKTRLSLFLMITISLVIPLIGGYFYYVENLQFLLFADVNNISVGNDGSSIIIFIVCQLIFSSIMIKSFISHKVYIPNVKFEKDVRTSNRNYIEDIREKTKMIDQLKNNLKDSHEFLEKITEYSFKLKDKN